MVPCAFKHLAVFACLLLELSVLISGKIVVSRPSAQTVWTPGETYTIKVQDDHEDKAVQRWQVDLMVLGAECDGICLHDGIVAEISKDYNTQSALQFQVPEDLVQYGKGFHVQFSNAGSSPIYISETFSIAKRRSKRSDKEGTQLRQRDISQDAGIRKSENAAPFVLPTVLATGMVLACSCVFAFFMI